VEDAWQRVLNRNPSENERAAAQSLVDRQTARLGSRQAAFAELTRGLLNLNEFLYVD